MPQQHSGTTPLLKNSAVTTMADEASLKHDQLTNISSDTTLTPEEERLKDYAHLLDNAIRLPGGFRIGLDGLVGLVPGIGDLIGAFLSGFLIYGSAKLDIPKRVVAQMVLNTVVETVIGLIPVIGDIFDFVFKANVRNAKLLNEALKQKEAERRATNDGD